jgi:hypothetical protein
VLPQCKAERSIHSQNTAVRWQTRLECIDEGIDINFSVAIFDCHAMARWVQSVQNMTYDDRSETTERR